VKNNSKCDMLRYVFIAKLQNVLIAPRTWFFGPPQVSTPNGTLIGSTFFAGLTLTTDLQTDHGTKCVATSHILYFAKRISDVA